MLSHNEDVFSLHSYSISAGSALFTFWVFRVSPAAVKVCVATPLFDVLNLTPERVQAEFIGALLLILGGRSVSVFAVREFSGCLVLRAGPGLHAHLGGAWIPGADIHTRKEITRMHANKWAATQRHIQTRDEWWSLRWCGEGETAKRIQRDGETKGAGWREGRSVERDGENGHKEGGSLLFLWNAAWR